MIELEIDSNVRGLVVGIVSAQSVAIGAASDELRAACAEIAKKVREQGMAGGDARKESVRQMIRHGGFKPSGRNKPAQEYLLRSVQEGSELPSILNVVDWINAVSLQSGFPISLLSAKSVGPEILVRYGQANEKFVFNRSGQELDLDGLICICASSGTTSTPLGTPIKDSMAGKVTEGDSEIVAFVYAPADSITTEEIIQACGELGRGFWQYCGAAAEKMKISIQSSEF